MPVNAVELDSVKASAVPLPAETDTESRSRPSNWHYGTPHTEATKHPSSAPSPAPKSQKLRKDGTPSNRPLSRDDYERYKFVLPSERSINRQKLSLATQCEIDAATALLDIQSGLKSTLHFDTTCRCGIDGEWVSLIISLSDGQRYRLCPIYLAYEDRENITRYIVESYQPLAVVATNAQEHNVTADDLWQSTTALMTEAVSKNFNVHRGINDALVTEYVPLHLLCKSHTVEGLDWSNKQVLPDVERAVQLREKIEAANPAIKRFTRGDKSVVITGVKSMLNKVSHEKSASPTNLAHLFDAICKREGTVKALYQERWLAKLGYVAGSILDTIPLLTMLWMKLLITICTQSRSVYTSSANSSAQHLQCCRTSPTKCPYHCWNVLNSHHRPICVKYSPNSSQICCLRTQALFPASLSNALILTKHNFLLIWKNYYWWNSVSMQQQWSSCSVEGSTSLMKPHQLGQPKYLHSQKRTKRDRQQTISYQNVTSVCSIAFLRLPKWQIKSSQQQTAGMIWHFYIRTHSSLRLPRSLPGNSPREKLHGMRDRNGSDKRMIWGSQKRPREFTPIKDVCYKIIWPGEVHVCP